MIKFGMSNTLITFIDNYYDYGGSESINDRGLTIGGYESDWLADFVASFILDNTKDLFDNTTLHYDIYRDDGIIFLKGKWTNEDIIRFIKTFQIRLDKLLNSSKLQFTTEIWRPTKGRTKTITIDKALTIIESPSFPFLDMEIFLTRNEKLSFKVHM